MSDPLLLSTCCPPDSGESVPLVRCAGRWLNRISPGSATADAVAAFVRRRFQQAYGADPELRVPAWLALTTAQGSLLAAVGIRNAGSERLFLEDYLSAPVEQWLPGGPERRHVVEIAHLAGVEAGVSRYLFAALAVWLDAEGYHWVVCTGTGQLRNGFDRLGIGTRVLAPADPDRLPNGGSGWGRYYEHRPVVMAMSAPDNLAALARIGLLQQVRPAAGHDPVGRADEGGRYGHTA